MDKTRKLERKTRKTRKTSRDYLHVQTFLSILKYSLVFFFFSDEGWEINFMPKVNI